MFKADAKQTSIDDGVWEEYQGCEFLIAHTSCLRFQRALARNQQPHQKKIQAGTLDPGVNRDLICKSMAEGLLLDWRKRPETKGDELPPYTIDAGYAALKNQPAFRDFVSEISLSLASFQQEEINEAGEA